MPPALASLVDECLYKGAEARPGSTNVHARLERLSGAPAVQGLAALQEANQLQVARLAEHQRSASQAQTAAERRAQLADAGSRAYTAISDELRGLITSAASAASASVERTGRWVITLGPAQLSMSSPVAIRPNPWEGWDAPPFEVISAARIQLQKPANTYGYAGRSHSLWFCDAQEEGRFRWYETAFMTTFGSVGEAQAPYALDPGVSSAKGLWRGLAEVQVAWPFTPLVPGDVEEFINRWATWLASASQGNLYRPGTMPERSTDGSWRR